MAGLRTASTEEVARLLEYARWKNRPFLKMDCEAELTRRQVQGRTEEDRRDARRAERYMATRPRGEWAANG